VTQAYTARIPKLVLNGTDLSVSRLCLGTNQFGTALDQNRVNEILDAFVTLGGNFIDTARAYGDWVPDAPKGASERAIGTWLRTRQRSDVVIATKGGLVDLRAKERRPRMTVEDIARDLEESLEHLQVERIDLYYVHSDDPSRPLEPVIDALIEYEETGRIRHLGLSNWSPERIRRAKAYALSRGRRGPVAVEPFWGLADPDRAAAAKQGYVLYYEDGFRPLHAEGLAMVPYCAQSRGFFTKLAQSGEQGVPPHLADVYLNDTNRRRLKVIRELADKHKATVNQIVLAYLLCQPQQTIPIIGPQTLEQLHESVGAVAIHLDAQELERLEAARA
jgi:aryl-alcohol dehydrogenase-like predicted oxidoreductase